MFGRRRQGTVKERCWRRRERNNSSHKRTIADPAPVCRNNTLVSVTETNNRPEREPRTTTPPEIYIYM